MFNVGKLDPMPKKWLQSDFDLFAKTIWNRFLFYEDGGFGAKSLGSVTDVGQQK